MLVTLALLGGLLLQSQEAVSFSSLDECVIGREVEALPVTDAPWRPRRPGVIMQRQSDPRSGRCLVRFTGPIPGDWIPFRNIYPRSAEAQVAAQGEAAAFAAAADLPQHLKDARSLFIASGPAERCRQAHLGIAAGPDLAREVVTHCGYISAQWDRAQAMEPRWDMTAMRAEAARGRAMNDYGNAVIAEHIRAQEEAAQAERLQAGPERTYGSASAYAGASATDSVRSTSGAFTTPTVSETTIRENMARDACFANVRNC